MNGLEYKEYRRKYWKTKNDGYIGPVTCSKCGEHGYMRRERIENVRTGTVYSRYLSVRHQHKEKVDGRWTTKYDGYCYIGYLGDN